MKKTFFTFLCCIVSFYSYSQEHIKFNGAVFGQPLNEFIEGFPKPLREDSGRPPKGYNSNLCNHKLYVMKLNSEWWRCHVFSSRTTNTVFRTVSVIHCITDLKSKSMLLVKALEEKYGGGIQEKSDELGEVEFSEFSNREMFALYYYIKNAQGRTIGEIRISVAPSSKDATNGLIELSYTDYSSRDKATKEYNTLMRDAL